MDASAERAELIHAKLTECQQHIAAAESEIRATLVLMADDYPGNDERLRRVKVFVESAGDLLSTEVQSWKDFAANRRRQQ